MIKGQMVVITKMRKEAKHHELKEGRLVKDMGNKYLVDLGEGGYVLALMVERTDGI